MACDVPVLQRQSNVSFMQGKSRIVRDFVAGTWVLLVALTSGTVAAQAPDPLTQAEFSVEARKCPRIVTVSQQLGCLIPEFGGAFVDSTKTLNIYLTDLASVPRAQRIVQLQLERHRRPQFPLRFIQGQYSFQQMNSILQEIGAYASKGGVASLMIDEFVNRIRIAYVTEDARARLEEGIKALGIPRQAIILEKGAYAQVL